MSMLSAQIDELRTMAAMLVIKDMSEVAAAVRDAADTIWQLRDDLQRANADNAKLVDVLHEVETDAVYAYHCLQSDIELVMKSETEFFEKWWHSECRNSNKLRRIEVLEADNAKLRKLVKQMHDHIKESCDICDEYYCSNFDEDNECCVYDTLAREVGIEVGE